MAQLSIDPIRTYFNVSKSLVGRILLFYLAGWAGVFLGRLAAVFQEWDDFLEPHEAFIGVFTPEHSAVVEFILMVAWPAMTAGSAAHFSVGLFLLVMPAIVITFVIFIYSEEPPPAWCLALIAVTSTIHVIGFEEATAVSWGVLIVFLAGIGSAFWWTLQVYHPELVETLGDLFRGRSSRPVSVMSERHKAPPGTWPDPVEGWNNREIRPPHREE